MRAHITRTIPITFSLLLSGGLLNSGAALAARAPAPQYLYFNADCTDCALAASTRSYGVVARLDLDQYAYGEPLTNGSFLENGNVVSFTYSGSNLVAPFQTFAQRAGEKYNPAGISSISGVINTGRNWPEPTDGMLDILFGRSERFTISLNGDWAYFADTSTSPLPNDYGHGTWSVTAAAVGPGNQQVPEPASAVLVGLSLAALVVARRKKTLTGGDTSGPFPGLVSVA